MPPTRGSPRRRAALKKIVVYRVPGTPGTAAFNGRGAEALAVVNRPEVGRDPARDPAGFRAGRTLKTKKFTKRHLRFLRRLRRCTDICNPNHSIIVSERFLAPSAGGSPPRAWKIRLQEHFYRRPDSPYRRRNPRVAGGPPATLNFTSELLPRTGHRPSALHPRPVRPCRGR